MILMIPMVQSLAQCAARGVSELRRIDTTMNKTNEELVKNILAALLVLATIALGTMLVMGFWR